MQIKLPCDLNSTCLTGCMHVASKIQRRNKLLSLPLSPFLFYFATFGWTHVFCERSMMIGSHSSSFSKLGHHSTKGVAWKCNATTTYHSLCEPKEEQEYGGRIIIYKIFSPGSHTALTPPCILRFKWLYYSSTSSGKRAGLCKMATTPIKDVRPCNESNIYASQKITAGVIVACSVSICVYSLY